MAGTVLVVVVVLVAATVVYVHVGCHRDWVMIGGLVVDGVGAGLLAKPDIERLAEGSTLWRLREARDELAVFDSVTLESDNELFAVVEPSVQEVEPVDSPRRLVFESGVIWVEKSDGGRVEVSRPPVELDVARRMHERERSVRRLGLFVLLAGFGLQVVGAISGTTLGLEVLGEGIQALGIPYDVC